MVEMVRAELSSVEKLARVPDAPSPVLPYSSKVTYSVLGSLELHSSQPAELMMSLKTVFWKQTLAYSDHGRPR